MVFENSHILLIDEAGKIIRISPSEIRTMGRQAKGVRLIRLDEGQKLATIVAFEGSGEEGNDEEQGSTNSMTAAVKLDGLPESSEYEMSSAFDPEEFIEEDENSVAQAVYEPAQSDDEFSV